MILGSGYEVPVDLVAVARALDIKVVPLRDGDALGETHRLTNGHEIRVATGQPESRRRFTLAHELAHVFLDDTSKRVTSTLALEQLCDRIAASILMPLSDVMRRLRQFTPTEVTAVARDFNVSVHAAAVRFAQLTRCSVFRVGSGGGAIITRLAGELRASTPAVRRAILHTALAGEETIAVVSNGTVTRSWHVSSLRMRNEDVLCVFRPRE